MAVMGHIFSPFLSFKGGKGIATSLGALLGLMPLVGLLGFAFWVVVLAFTRMISAASIAACMALPLIALGFRVPTAYLVVAILMSLFALLKHIPNMKRIRAGVEPKLGAKKPV